MLHPASLLVLWGGFAIALQAMALPGLLGMAGTVLVLGMVTAEDRLWRLLRRSRWLFLSIAVLFLFFTPGEYLANPLGNFGVSYEGLTQASSHIGLLLAMLASLAVLHEQIGTDGILAGLYGLLRPLGISRAALVRVSLVLDLVERPPVDGWRAWLASPAEGQDDDAIVTLTLYSLRWYDQMILTLVCCGVLAWLVMS